MIVVRASLSSRFPDISKQQCRTMGGIGNFFKKIVPLIDKPVLGLVTKILWATTHPPPITFGLVTVDYASAGEASYPQ